ncbi:hypothetical protein [Janthinobacterium lividum]|uniref:hypothetical protein n=1 Tax=Janthinobacterium lividum TaxID=29581 RepID=UPI0015961B8B|nr:hypothetical protein [Janthinobacterium lividum]QKY12155.1 hypothetical protein G8765_30290 [Janthinobacterium lividum]
MFELMQGAISDADINLLELDPKCGAGGRRGGKEQVEEVKPLQAAACDEALWRLAASTFN